MDSFELNKIAGGLIAASLMAMVVGKMSGMIVHPATPEKSVFEAVESASTPGAVAAAPAELDPIAPLLANANLANGETAFNRRCAVCHTTNDGGPNKVGPNLWSVVGGKYAHLDTFNYSTVMRERGGTWDYESLNKFIARPAAYMRGTKMAFAGVGNANERADIIAWLRTQHSSPPPLPE